MVNRFSSKVIFFLFLLFSASVHGWEWSDLVRGNFVSSGDNTISASSAKTLTYEEVQLMRVRDLKWHLARNHGYSADELGRILDKRELINALAYEEDKVRQTKQAELRRAITTQGIIVSLIAVFVIFLWPVISGGLHHLFEITAVNLVVYYDRKKYEATRCWEVKSKAAILGIILMFMLDALSLWLSVSIPLSWVCPYRYKYLLFPTPSLPVKPGQFLGEDIAKSPVGSYGINVAPMAISWALRFAYSRIELLTAKALANAQRMQRQSSRESETPEERSARRAARKAAKAAAREATGSTLSKNPDQTLPPEWMEPSMQSSENHVNEEWVPQTTTNGQGETAMPAHSEAHEEFMKEMEQHTMPHTELDELD